MDSGRRWGDAHFEPLLDFVFLSSFISMKSNQYCLPQAISLNSIHSRFFAVRDDEGIF